MPRPLFLILPWRIVTIHAPGVGRAMCRENPPAGRRMAWIRRRSSRGIETFRMSPPPVGIGVGDQAGDDGPKGSTCEVTHRGGGRSRGEIVTGILPRFCRKSPKTNPVADRCVEDAAPAVSRGPTGKCVASKSCSHRYAGRSCVRWRPRLAHRLPMRGRKS